MDELRTVRPAGPGRVVPGKLLLAYLERAGTAGVDPSSAAFYASVDTVAATDPEIADSILRELDDQRSNVKLIASENYCSLAVQART